MKMSFNIPRIAICIIGLILISATGCTSIALEHTDEEDYILREDGVAHKFHAENIAVQSHIIPAGPRYYILLVTELTKPQDQQTLRKIVNQTPPWRNLESIFVLVYRLALSKTLVFSAKYANKMRRWRRFMFKNAEKPRF